MSTSVRSAAASLRVFLDRIIDYAGLFPPASLDMMTSVNNYSTYLNARQRWALGRFVLPVARLDEFLNAQENVAADPWHLSGIISANIEADLAAVDEFNRKASGAVIDTIEVRVRDLDEVDLVRKNQPPSTAVFFEFAPEQADEFLPTLRHVRRMRETANRRHSRGSVSQRGERCRIHRAVRGVRCTIQSNRWAASSLALLSLAYL